MEIGTRSDQLFLDALDHCHGGDQNKGGNYLVRPERGVEESPGDADRGECLQHFKISGGRGPGQPKSLKVNQKGNAARDGGKQGQKDDCLARVSLAATGQSEPALSFP